MAKKETKTGKELEKRVADAYRAMGAWKVEHDKKMAGNQIDVYVELETPGHLLHRIAVEAKDYAKPVGIKIINDFEQIVNLMRREPLVDEGIIVSANGFSKQARNAAQTYGLRLLEIADLEAQAEEAKAEGRTRPTKPPIALPPTPYFAHPYPLQANFTGRVKERQTLTQWLTHNTHPVMAVIALGGMGKSALTWAWVQRDVLGQPLPGETPDACVEEAGCRVAEAARPEGMLWWSFYEREAGFGNFLDAALAYVSGGQTDPTGIPSTHEKVQALLVLLQQRHVLLVLDGFERALRAYASLGAAYQGNEVTEDARGDYRACVDPHAGLFLQWAASLPLRGRVLLTSRLFPREMDGLPGCYHAKLTALAPEDAVIFLRAQGVKKGTRAEIQAACKPYGYHPLALRLLAGVIARDKRTPGDVRVAARHPVLAKLKGKEGQGQHHVLQVAYDTLEKRKQTLLSRFAAFRSPMDYTALLALNPFKSEAPFDAALDELTERGLLLHDQESGTYDLHPVVRRYAYECLGNKEGVHTQLRDYFAAVPQPEEIENLADLAPVIELYHHTVRAGQYDEACDLFHERLNQLTYYRFGAYQLCIELLHALFPGGEPVLPLLSAECDSPSHRYEVAFQLAERLLGEIEQTVKRNA